MVWYNRDMKIDKDFALFQKVFGSYREMFGLTGYRTYFKHEKLDGAFADITIEQPSMVVTVRLNKGHPIENKAFEDVERSAKHEALHLLLGKLEDLAYDRHCRKSQIYEAIEEVVFKLEKLIPNNKA